MIKLRGIRGRAGISRLGRLVKDPHVTASFLCQSSRDLA